MIPHSVLTSLYAGSGMATVAFYLPQLLKLITSAEARRAMSPLSWGGWTVAAWISLAYAALAIGDTAMVMVGAANALCQSLVFTLAMGQRLADRG